LYKEHDNVLGNAPKVMAITIHYESFLQTINGYAMFVPKNISNFVNYLNLKQRQGIIENPRMKGVRGNSLCHSVKIMKGATT
jgi:hypothetical protein